ncbi:phage tail assembly protein [Lysinibacillus sp. M3]|uniref:Phage tail assembly protein n=1 Tax=Lysinibacillus zambalensis TaxID=3160866 RepID=A0ABV1MTT2_9BACI
MSQKTENQNETSTSVVNATETTAENPDLKIITLKSPIEIDGALLNEVKLDFGKMTGADLFKIDAELKAEGHMEGFNSVYNQEVLLKVASKASGIIPDDLLRLSFRELVEVTFSARNFFMGY